MNLRAFLQDLESKSPEEIWRSPGEVEPGSDITALVLELERRGEYPVLWFERVRGSRGAVSLLSRDFYTDKLLEWGMRDEQFKVSLFRFDAGNFQRLSFVTVA